MQLAYDVNVVPVLISMVGSEFPLMQNEAIVALTLMSGVLLPHLKQTPENSADILPLIQKIKSMLSSTSTLPEIICNLLTLTQTLCTTGKYKLHNFSFFQLSTYPVL